MLVAAQTKDVHPGPLELLQKEVAFSIVELGLLTEGPEAPPVKFRQRIIEVAPGDRKRGQCAVSWGCLQAQGGLFSSTSMMAGLCPLETHRSYSG